MQLLTHTLRSREPAQATSDYYRNIYADPLLGPIFKASQCLGAGE